MADEKFIPVPDPLGLAEAAFRKLFPEAKVVPRDALYLLSEQTSEPTEPQPAENPVQEPSFPPTFAPVSQLDKSPKGTACLPCSRHHLTTASGALSEAIRFARSGGIKHLEVVRRLAIAEEELDIMERIDITPANMALLSDREKGVAHWVLNESRNLRHLLDEMEGLTELEAATAQAQNINIEFRAKLTNLSPEETARLKEMANKPPAKKEAIKAQAWEFIRRKEEKP